VSARLIVVTGTGTGIGKTHLACALLEGFGRALREQGRAADGVAGLKPIETGVGAGIRSDASQLEQASTFHVKRFPPPYMLTRAVSAHLAARDEGVRIEASLVRSYVESVRAEAEIVVVELPGGLFSPLGPSLSNAELTRALQPDNVILVAPDRLGVLHDVAATSRAAAAMELVLTGVVLVAPEHPDTSTGTNATELTVVTNLGVLASLPRADVAALAAREDLQALARSLLRSVQSAQPLPL
jgi:dethiobiotin synthetase